MRSRGLGELVVVALAAGCAATDLRTADSGWTTAGDSPPTDFVRSDGGWRVEVTLARPDEQCVLRVTLHPVGPSDTSLVVASPRADRGDPIGQVRIGTGDPVPLQAGIPRRIALDRPTRASGGLFTSSIGEVIIELPRGSAETCRGTDFPYTLSLTTDGRTTTFPLAFEAYRRDRTLYQAGRLGEFVILLPFIPLILFKVATGSGC